MTLKLRLGHPLSVALVIGGLLLIGWIVAVLPGDPLSPNARRDEVRDAVGPAAHAATTPTALDAPARAAVDPPTDTIALVMGRVLRVRDGLPLADAEVRLERDIVEAMVHLDVSCSAPGAPLAVTHSERDGAFAFGVALTTGLRLRVVADGFGVEVRRVEASAAEQIVRLADEAVLEGRVLAAGQPRDGVRLRLRVQATGAELAVAQSDAAGWYRFAGLPPIGLLLEVADAAHGLVRQRLQLAAGEVVVRDLELPGGGTANGLIVDAMTGAAIAGVSVSDVWTMARCAESDSLGQFALGGLQQNTDVLYLSHPDYADLEFPIDVAACTDLHVPMLPATRIVGRVLDDVGEAVAGAYVAIAPGDAAGGLAGGRWQSTRTTVEGAFQLRGPTDPGGATLVFAGSGLATVTRPLPPYVVADWQVSVGDVTLAREALLAVRVVDGEALPVDFGTLRLGAVDAKARPAVARVRELRTGPAVTFGGLAPGEYRLEWSRAGAVRDAVAELQVLAGRTTFTLTVDPGGQASGRVVPWPLPVTGAYAYVEALAGAARRTAAIAPDGAFRLVGLDSSVYSLQLMGVDGWAAAVPIQVAAGEDDVVLDVRALQSRRGRVLWPPGGDAERVRVSAFVDGASPRVVATTVADGDGGFALSLPPGFLGRVQARGLQSGCIGACDVAGGGPLLIELRALR